jgi:hypothetical protein
MSDSLMFSLTLGGILVDKAIASSEVPFANATGGMFMGSLDMVHFEAVRGCFRFLQIGTSEPRHVLHLNDVTREACGTDPFIGDIAQGDPFGFGTTIPVSLLIDGRFDRAVAFNESLLILLPANSEIKTSVPVSFRTVTAGPTLKVLTPDTVNVISVSGTVPPSGNIIKNIKLDNPAQYYAFELNMKYTTGVGGFRKAYVSGVSDFSGVAALVGAANPVITESVTFPVAGQVRITLTNSTGTPVPFTMETVNLTGMSMSFL